MLRSTEILSFTQVQQRVQANPAKRWVSTNGCFDLLHVGHLRYLQAARAEGEGLIVAVNSDSSVQGLKGPKRPIVGQQERAELLAGLACVDLVFIFDEPSPGELLAALKPAVYVKGGQYTEATLPEAPVLKAVGTRLVFTPMSEGASTSLLIERIVGLNQP
jgi:rfaE bifunctional protein nucleotidyltransferase chain/domain